MSTTTPRQPPKRPASVSEFTRRTPWQDLPAVLNVLDAAALLDVCDKTIYELLAQGVLDHRKLGKRILIPRWALARYLGAELELLAALGALGLENEADGEERAA